MSMNPKKADQTHLKRTDSVIHGYSRSPDPIRPEIKRVQHYEIALDSIPTRAPTVYQRMVQKERKIYQCSCGIHTYNTTGKCFLCQSRI